LWGRVPCLRVDLGDRREGEREGESLNRRRFLGVRGEEMLILGKRPVKGSGYKSDYCSRFRLRL
jgi:hypothetical protein